MELMLNRCPTSSYDQVCQVVKKELGRPLEDVCISILFQRYLYMSPKRQILCFLNNLTIVSYFGSTYFMS
ncbi:hypothetical protein Hanom_Chr13g01237001 [Helianthus anomalus]